MSASAMNLPGSLQLIWWPPVERAILPAHIVEHGFVTVTVRKPALRLLRGRGLWCAIGTIRWSLLIGYIELRRLA